ncbi:MAG: MFS transporter [Pseudomonadota bacterium]
MSPAFTTRDGVLTSGYYGVLFFGLGAHLPYWPVWLEDWGLDEAAIAWLLGLAILVRVIGGTVLPALADRYGVRRLMLGVMGVFAAIAFALHALAGGIEALIVLTILSALFSAPLIPLGEAMGLRAALRGGFAYAHARAIGSVAFLAMVLGMGQLLQVFGTDAVLVAVVLCFICVAALGMIHPGGGTGPRGEDRAQSREMRLLALHPIFLLFAATIAFGHSAHAVYYAYSVLHWQAAGLTEGLIGALWAFGVAAEILLMLGPGPAWVARLGPAQALGLAAAAGILRWSLMMTEPLGPLLWFCQGLHSLSYGLSLLGMMAFLAQAVPDRVAGTAQGLAAGLLSGLTMAAATMLAGWLAPATTPGGLYGLALGSALLAAVAALALARVWDGGRLLD